MKKQALLFSLSLAVLAGAGAQTPGDTINPGKNNDKMVIRPGKPNDDMTIHPGTPNDDMAVLTDSGFINRNITDHIMAVRLARLAQEKSTNSNIKKIAALMLRDHTKMLIDFKKLATKKHLHQPASPASNSVEPVQVKQPGSFDARWASLVFTMHQSKVAEYEKFASITMDADIKQVINGALPKLRIHLQLLSKIPGVTPGVSADNVIH